MLLFDNLSGDPEQEYFADGVVEGLITRLSHWRLLPVIARNSSLAYKGQAVDVKQVSQELGTRYILESSVQGAESSSRVTAQLLDAKDRTHLWAGRYDNELSAPDIFAIQDEITEQVAGTIAGLFGVVHR